jgi:hypothetical protein
MKPYWPTYCSTMSAHWIKGVGASNIETSASQCQPQHLQCPLGQAPLATVYKDVDIQHASQLELLLFQDSIWSTHSNSNSLSSNAANWPWKHLPRLLGSSLSALAALWPTHSHQATEHGEPQSLTQGSPMRLALHQLSSGIYVVVSPSAGTDIPQRF